MCKIWSLFSRIYFKARRLKCILLSYLVLHIQFVQTLPHTSYQSVLTFRDEQEINIYTRVCTATGVERNSETS